MAAVSSQTMPGGFQPFSLLNGPNGNGGGSRDGGGALKALLAEPLEFKETATVVNGLDNPGERGWIEVNPVVKVSFLSSYVIYSYL